MATPFRRPLGVSVALVILALHLLIALGLAILVAAPAFWSGVAAARGVSVPCAGPIPVLFRAPVALIFAGIGVWTGSTCFGLSRLHPAARRSILLFSTGLLGLGVAGVAALATSGLPGWVIALPMSGPSLSPFTMQNLPLFTALFFSVVAGNGAWWLIYFNLPSVAIAFRR